MIDFSQIFKSIKRDNASNATISNGNPSSDANKSEEISIFSNNETTVNSNCQIDNEEYLWSEEKKQEEIENNKDAVIEDNNYFDVDIKKLTSIESQTLIQLDETNSISTSEYINHLLNKKVGFDTKEEYQSYILDKFTLYLEDMKATYQAQEDSNGWFSDLYDGAKEFFGFGTSSKDAEDSIAKYEQIIQGLKDAINGNSDMTFEQAYEYYTGTSFSKEKIDKYMETSNIYSAIMVGCQYDEDYIEKFEQTTGKSVNEVMQTYAQCQLDTFGEVSDVKNILNEYIQDQQTYSDKLSSIVSTTGLACTVAGAVASFFCPPVGVALMQAGKYVALSGMFIDNAIDLVDNATDSDGLTKDEVKELALETGVEAVSYATGRGIGKFTNGLNNVVSSKVAQAGASNVISYIAGQAAETFADTGLSLAADYAIAQGQSLIATGEFMDSEDYWSLDRFLGEGKNQLIGILTGLSSAKVNAYQQGVIKTAQGMILDGDIDGAKTYLKKSGIKMDDTSFDGFAKNVQEVDTRKPNEIEVNPAKKFADEKLPTEINQQLSARAVELSKKYEKYIDEVKTEIKQRFADLETVEDKNITARSKSDESTFNKIAKKMNQGKLKSTDYDACLDVVGDAYGTRIQMNSIDSEVAKLKIIEALDGTDITYEQFVTYLTKQGTFDNVTKQKIEEVKIPVLDVLKTVQSQEVVDRLVQIINDANPLEPEIITELSNYGSNVSSYFTDAQLQQIAIAYEAKYGKKLDIVTKLDEGNLPDGDYSVSTDGNKIISVENSHAKYTDKGATKDSGYTSSQMNTKHQLSDGSVGNGELQVRGTKVNAFADAEHIPYDIREGKIKENDPKYSSIYKIIKDMDAPTYDAYNKYLTAVYESLRLNELGISCEEPKIESFLDVGKFSANDLNLLSRSGLEKLHSQK